MSRPTTRSKLTSSGSRSNLKSKAGRRESAGLEEEEETEPEIPQLAWAVLSEEVVKELLPLTVGEAAKKLASVLSLTEHEQSLQQAAQLDYYVAGYWFSREHNFTPEQTSAFFSLLHRMLHNLQEKQLSLSENVAELQALLGGVGVSKNTALRCFSPEQGVLAVEYLSSSLLQHYRLFQFLSTERQQLEEISQRPFVCLPPDPSSLSPPPLEEAIPLEFYQRCIAPQPPSETQDDPDGIQPLDAAEKETEIGLLNISPEEVKMLMDTIVTETLTTYQSQVTQRIKSKEEAMLNKLAKLEKAVT